MIRNQAS
jgi:hypothetical protein